MLQYLKPVAAKRDYVHDKERPRFVFAIATHSELPTPDRMKESGIVCCEMVNDVDNLKYVIFTTENKMHIGVFQHELRQMGVVPHQLSNHPIVNTFGKGKSKRNSIFYRKIKSPALRHRYKLWWTPRINSKNSSTPMVLRHKRMLESKASDTETEEDDDEEPAPPAAAAAPPPREDLELEVRRLKDVLSERERYVETLKGQLELKDRQLKALAATL